jgi:hypothetical protein
MGYSLSDFGDDIQGFGQGTKEFFMGTGPVAGKAKYGQIDPRVQSMQSSMSPWLTKIGGMAEEARNRDFAGDALMRSALDRAARQQMGAAASTRGLSPVAAARLGGQMGNQMRMEAMPQIAALRAQEQAQQYKDILQALGMGGELQYGVEKASIDPYTTIEAARLGGTMPGQPGLIQQTAGALGVGLGTYFGTKAGMAKAPV